MPQRGSQVSTHSAPSPRPNGAPSNVAPHRAATPPISEDAIAMRAYHKFLARAGAAGSAEQDWVEAERELLAEAGGR
jgi:hypothetical protein